MQIVDILESTFSGQITLIRSERNGQTFLMSVAFQNLKSRNVY